MALIISGTTLTLEDVPSAWVKQSVRAATTTSITLSGTQTIDGITLSVDDRVLVKNQTASQENGIYVVSAGAWSRSFDANTASEIAGAQVAVSSGTTNGGTTWDTNFKSSDTLDTTAMTWNAVVISAGPTLTPDVVISGSSSGSALRITQTGSGNALLVEDSTNPDSTPFVIGGSGNVGIGTTSTTGTNAGIKLHVTGTPAGAGPFGYGIVVAQSVPTSHSLVYESFRSYPTTDASTNLQTLRHFYANQNDSLGAGSSIGTQIGFLSGTTMTGATTNYGFLSEIASSTGRYNFYASGTAPNVFAGTTHLGGLIGSEALRATTTASSVNYFNATGATTTNAPVLSVEGSDANINLRLASKGTGQIQELVSSTYYSLASQFDVGTNANQIPLNQYLGTMAYEDGVNYNTAISPNVISVNSSSTALRITQTGSGNAFLVEDDTNVDASPFVIDASGILVTGAATAVTTTAGAGRVQSIGVLGTFTGINSAADATAPITTFGKNRAGAIVQVDDQLGAMRFEGFDGANYVRGAQIFAQVDGTPGTNDMPGRLVFSTTADGASSPTERMRINSAGQVGFGGIGGAGQLFNVVQNITGATSGFGVWSGGQIQSDVTSQASYFVSIAATAAASFTLANLNHYNTFQSTFGAGSTVTNQYGFAAAPSLTGATNNFGFYSNLASATGRWNFYAAGTAANYFAGNVLVGRTYTGTERIGIGGGTSTISSGTGAFGILNDTIVSSAQTSFYDAHSTYIGTEAATFTISNLRHYRANQQPLGASSVITNQSGFVVDGALTGATNNFGFYSNLASATGRWNFYAAGTAANYFAGNTGIGGLPTTDAFRISGTASGSAFTNGQIIDQTIGSGVTGSYRGLMIRPIMQDAAFTLSTLYHVYVNPQTKPATPTLTNQYGFTAESTLTDATSNYGFFGKMAAASGRWNFYGGGTAANHFSGTLSIGTPAVTHNLEVNKSLTGGVERYQALLSGEIQSDVTTLAVGALVNPTINNSAFTLATYRGFQASAASISGAATISAYHGFFHGAVTAANITNSYGYTSNIAASGTARWNFYAGGTAPNYFAGSTYVLGTGGDQALNVNGAVRVAAATTANQTSAGTMDFTAGAMRFLVWGASGTQGNFTWWTGTGALGATQRMTLTGSNNLGLATSTFGTNATNTLSIASGTAPASGVADTVQYYSMDLSAGNTMPAFYTEGTNVGTGTPTANRTIAVNFNGTTYYLLASTTTA